MKIGFVCTSMLICSSALVTLSANARDEWPAGSAESNVSVKSEKAADKKDLKLIKVSTKDDVKVLEKSKAPEAHKAVETPKAAPVEVKKSEVHKHVDVGLDDNKQSYRSDYTDHFVFSAQAGMDPIGDNLVPPAFRLDFTARAQINRWAGVLVNYHNTWVDTHARHGSATARHQVLAIGPAVRAWEFGKTSKFWHGSYFLAHAQYQYVKTKYRFYSTYTPAGVIIEDSRYVGGWQVGADLFFPMWVGFWANLGYGVEGININYPIVNEPGGDKMDLPSTMPYLRVGFSYSI